MQSSAKDTAMIACRTCMRKPFFSKCYSLFDPSLRPAIDILVASTSIKIIQDDGLPDSVCAECHERLTSFHEFCQQSVRSDQAFRRSLPVKLELHEEELTTRSEIRTSAEQPDDREWPADFCVDYGAEHESSGSDQQVFGQPSDDHKPRLAANDCPSAANDAADGCSDDDDDDGNYGLYDVTEVDEETEEQPPASPPHHAESAPAKYQCDMCGQQFAHRYRIEGHLREHRGLAPYPCPDCEQAFDKRYELRLHRELKHNRTPADSEAASAGGGEERFVCDYEGCSKSYKNRRSITEHINRIHLGKRKCVASICETCGKSFQTRPNLMQHMKTHMDIEQYPYQCDVCQKRFNVQYSFKIHMMRHNNIRNFPCPLCPSRMCTKPELDNHVANHNRDVPWPCAECPSVFNRKASMQRHVLKVHRGHKPYVCTECGRAFGKKWTLKNHMLRHTGEKPHACPVCDRRFVQLVTLKTHMKMHNK